jgi:hypothetical protein
MTPKEFVTVLDEWTIKGGALPEGIPHDYVITTVDEATAVCRALSSGHIYAISSIGLPALHGLLAFFQSVETDEACAVFRGKGLPLLRKILSDGLNGAQVADSEDRAAEEGRRAETHLFLVKILAMYQQPGDARLIVEAARDPSMPKGYLWSVIFGIVAERHPEAIAICEGLREPLPEGFLGVAYLDFANALAIKRLITCHPFDSNVGIARLVAYLASRDPELYSYAVSATASIPFVNASARETLMACADQHPDSLVRLEGAWALAKTGSEFGRQRLAQLSLNPRYAERAVVYLEELGLGAHIPSRARAPDFQAIAKMCSWLMHPNEFGRPPDEIMEYDTRELNWPPTGDRRRFWLFKYRYEPQGADGQAGEGIGLVGSTTFALFGEATPDLAPEDIYGLHCCWELQMQNDTRAPEKRNAAIGRQMLAEANPGFP